MIVIARKSHRVALAVTTGILLGASFPPLPTGSLAFVALVPLLLLVGTFENTGQVFRYSYLSFLAFNLTTVYWISGWWGDDPWLKVAGVAVNLVHPLLFTVPIIAFFKLLRKKGWSIAIYAFPFLWVTYEWLAQLPELSFPWLILGNSQSMRPEAIQYASITGVYGISFLICIHNSIVSDLLRRFLAGKARRMFTGTAVVTLFLIHAGPMIHSAFIMNEPMTEHTIKIGIAQPNIDPYEKWAEGETPISKVRNLLRLYDSIAVLATPALVLLPETAFPFLIRQPSYMEEWHALRNRVDSTGVPLLTGFADITWFESDPPPSARKLQNENYWYQTFNSSMLLLPGQSGVQVYHKSKLTPMAERIPYLDALPFLQDVLTWGVGISNWGLGDDSTVFDLDARTRIWAMICYETLYPSFVADFVERGANVLAVITNDGWFDNTSGPHQLEYFTAVRAIENRRAVARCANNGISCFIDPYGRVSQETAFGTRTWIAAEIPIRNDLTFYTRHKDWLAYVSAVMSILVFVVPLRRMRHA